MVYKDWLRDVAHDRFVFDAPQRDERHAHRVDDGGRAGYLATVAFRVPRETPAGRVVAVVVKERRYGVVEVVEVAVGDADAGLGEGAADAGEEERCEKKREERQLFFLIFFFFRTAIIALILLHIATQNDIIHLYMFLYHFGGDYFECKSHFTYLYAKSRNDGCNGSKTLLLTVRNIKYKRWSY